MASNLQLKNRTALFAREHGYKKISDNPLKLILDNCHVQMTGFVKKRYSQELVCRNYFGLSETDYPGNSSIAGGYTLSGWAEIHNGAHFFNRTKYYSEENLGCLLPEQIFEISKKFGHEIGHVFTPMHVIEKARQAVKNRSNTRHAEIFADDFSREFCEWAYNQRIENLSGYEEGSLVLPN